MAFCCIARSGAQITHWAIYTYNCVSSKTTKKKTKNTINKEIPSIKIVLCNKKIKHLRWHSESTINKDTLYNKFEYVGAKNLELLQKPQKQKVQEVHHLVLQKI